MPGLVMANVGHWRTKTSGTTVNVITADRRCSLVNAGVYVANLVEVEKVVKQAVAS